MNFIGTTGATGLWQKPLFNVISQHPMFMTSREIGGYLANEFNNFKNAYTGATEQAIQQNFLNQQMAFNAQEAEKNREFQRQMSSTAYQRMAEDLKKAGFNPALAVGSGGASTPTGSLASTGLATAPNVTASATARFNNYLTSTEKTFNNLVTNAFNLFNNFYKTNGQIVSSLLNIVPDL